MKAYRLVISVLAFACLIVLLPDIVGHYLWLLGGEGLPYILVGRWDVVLVNILFFLFFIVLISYKRRADWRSRNIYAAFIIALFAEMYGFPLTAYFVAKYLGVVDVDYRPAYSVSFCALGLCFTLPTMMIVGSIVTIIGLVLIVLGWYGVYRGRGAMVTSGVYKYSRHPQYVGILLVTFGWLLHWPTLLTLLMWPVLAVVYYRLARSEEAWLMESFPAEFEAYRRGTPMFV